MPKQVDLKLTNLLLDPENPRLPEGERSQLETLHAMLRAEGPKTLSLAQSVAKEGLSPMERLLVMPMSGDPKRYVVLEGNRRVTALKLLSEPALADGVLSASQLKSLRRWSADYRTAGELEVVPCVVFATRAEANVWIERRHRGDQGGVGIVRWGATESARFDARRSGKRAPELQVLDFVSERASLDAATREKLHNVSITNLKRLIRDKHVRDTLGISLDGEGRVLTDYPDAEVLKGLVKLVRDLAHEKIKVADIYTAKERKKYVGTLTTSERPAAAKANATSRPLIGDGSQSTAIGSAGGGKKTTKAPKPRATLIPSSCLCDVKGAKLRNIYGELRRMKVEDYPNAISVLLRVFLELSVDDLIEKEGLMTEQQAENSKLRDKTTRVADHLEAAKRLTSKQAKAAKKVANDQHIIAGTVTSFHQYVHNKELAASPTDLRTTWDNLEPLFTAIWPGKVA